MTADYEQSDEWKMVEKAAEELSEHFDSVQIFCTRHEGAKGTTEHIMLGKGNWFARMGSVQEFITRNDEGTRIEKRGDEQ